MRHRFCDSSRDTSRAKMEGSHPCDHRQPAPVVAALRAHGPRFRAAAVCLSVRHVRTLAGASRGTTPTPPFAPTQTFGRFQCRFPTRTLTAFRTALNLLPLELLLSLESSSLCCLNMHCARIRPPPQTRASKRDPRPRCPTNTSIRYLIRYRAPEPSFRRKVWGNEGLL